MIKKIICFTLFFFYYSIFLMSQVTTVGHVTCEVISPLRINNVSRLEFGDIEKTKENKELVVSPVLTTSSELTIVDSNNKSEITANIIESSTTSNFSFPATFNLSGEPNSIYNISLPSSILITKIGGTESMVVNSFTSMPTRSGKLDNIGIGAISVGAKLNINGDQTPGLYKSTTSFEVCVNYE
jgi:hypothetical protein